tara:strand:- start:17514 stop:17972 length:459 start_codon:yes stop_codon:yes gene_type:complete
MKTNMRNIALIFFCCFLLLCVGFTLDTQLSSLISSQVLEANNEPDFTLRASPQVGLAPVEILFIAQLRGGSDDYEEFYCTTIEWDWDDDTRSSSTPDCDPYVPGQSKIRRRFSTRHEFEYPGRYTIRVYLRKSGEVVATARTSLELRGGRFN